MHEKLLTPRELADELQVPLASVYDWRYRGVGPAAIRVGKHLRYRREDVDRWLEAQRDLRPTR
jgi:excisionase family DNA binding protein